MFSNYLKIALRNLWKYRFYAGINILGLATGMLCFLFIFAFVQNERSFDLFHQNADRIHRINFVGKIGENELNIPQVGAPVGAVLQEEFPEVESFVRMRESGDYLVNFGNQSFYESGVIHSDSTLFDVLDFKLLSGQADEVLRRPNTAVITESIAKKYFGRQDPIGKALRFDNEDDIVIEGVIADIPENSHIQKDIFVALSSLEESRSPLWTNMNFYTYFALREHASLTTLEDKLPEFLRRHIGAELEKFMQLSFEDFIAAGNRGAFTITPLPDIYFTPQFATDLGPTSDRNYLYIFAAIGLFILLLAAVNFINLATARATTRSQEVGVRKVIGALRSQLIGQFLSESTILASIALVVAVTAMKLLLPAFNTLTGKSLTFGQIWSTPGIVLSCLALVIGIGLLAGAYPSLVLARFEPLQTMKKQVAGGNSRFRNGLVVFQFVVTSLLLIGTFTVYQQMQYIQQKKLGFNKDQLLLLEGVYGLEDKADLLADKVAGLPQVSEHALTSYLPTPSSRNTTGYFLGNSNVGAMMMLQVWYVDENYLPTMGMQLKEGRNFTPKPADENSLDIIVNEAMLAEFGITDDPIGKQISRNFGSNNPNEQTPELTTYNIVGVVKNFHFDSFREKIKPLVMHQGNSSYYLAMRVSTDDFPGLISTLETEWKALSPTVPFSYSFVDESFNKLYRDEIRMGKIATLFAGLSMLIACIGLLGLATFTALQRQKEVSIRKVLGASVSSLFLLLTKDFGKLIIIAFLIAVPIAYYLMQQWLESFAYAAPVGWQVIAVTAMLLSVVALLAVSYQSLRTAFVNPANSLRKDG